MRRLQIILIAIAGWLGISAQSASDSVPSASHLPPLYRDYQTLKRSDPWLTSPNAAALVRYADDNIAEAELSLTRRKGGLCDFYQSPDALQVSACIESFHRLNERTVVFGAMSYDNLSGNDMAGSAFIHHPTSSRLPFDLVEDSLTNTGRKHLDTYQLVGGVGIDLWRGLSLGARLDYTAANYAKYKDLRHKNKLMDLQLTVGAYLPLGNWGALGANYLYHRNTESLQFSTYGKTDRTYQTLISYGAFMGRVEQFGGNGYTDRSREMPLVSDYNGLSAQFSVQLSPLSVYNNFTYARRSGYYGRRSPFTITYADHQSDTYRYDASLQLTLPRSRHHLDLCLNAENLTNFAATFREQQNDAGATYYDYYTPVKTADKLWVDGTVALTTDLYPQHLCRSVSDGHVAVSPSTFPTWTFQLGLNWHHRHHTAYVYPYGRRQKLTSRELFVTLCRNVVTAKAKAVWTFALDGSFRQGEGDPFEDFTLAEPSDKQTPPASMDAYLWREYQWLMAPQYAVGGKVKYAFVFPNTQLKTHVSLSLHHRKANQTYEYSNGKDRTEAVLAIGCTF